MSDRAIGGLILTGIVLAIGLIYVISHFEQVDEGEACAVTRFGDLTGVVGPGAHMRGPFEGYHCYSTRLAVYEAAENPDESDADYADTWVDTQTNDGQEITIPFRITFRIPEQNVRTVYRNVAQGMDQVVTRVVTTHSRPIVRQLGRTYSAAELYGGQEYSVSPTNTAPQEGQVQQDKVPELEQRAFEALLPIFEQDGVELVSVRVSKPAFDAAYVNAIQEKQIAYENIQKEANNAAAADQTALATEARARGEANAEIERAKGDAEATRLRADARRYEIEEQGKALAAYPEILQLEWVESLGESTIYLPSETIEFFAPLPQPE